MKTLVALATGVFFCTQDAAATDVFASRMFLKNEYTVTLDSRDSTSGLYTSSSSGTHHRFFAAVDYERYKLRWSDGWDLSLNRKGENASTGFESNFKYITLGANIRSNSWIEANMTIHPMDSILFIGASIGRGDWNMGHVKWIVEDDESVPDIDAGWVSHLYKKGLIVESRLGNHTLVLSGKYINSNPENADSEYFIRDSINIWNLGAEYKWKNVSLDYDCYRGDATIYGIRKQDDSRKRFLYAPLEGQAHIGTIQWNNILGAGAVSDQWNASGQQNAATQRNASGHLLDFKLAAGYAKVHLDNDGERFHETLAPNRALRSSLMQVLSFSFLQKNYRIDADLEAVGALTGFAYSKPFTSGPVTFVPQVSADFYYAQGSADIKQTAETTKFLGMKSTVTNYAWEANSIGSLVGLGFELGAGHVHLKVAAQQILPFTFEVDDNQEVDNHKDDSSESSDGLSSADLLDNLGNGLQFTAQLNISF